MAEPIRPLGEWYPTLPDSLIVVRRRWGCVAATHLLRVFPGIERQLVVAIVEDQEPVPNDANLLLEVREPLADPARTPGDYWHDDGAGYAHVLMWSNREQPLIRNYGSTEEFSAPPGWVVMVDNYRTEHRAPEVTSSDRWFARALLKCS